MEPKKTSPWVWVGIGCGVAFVGLIAFIVFIVTVVFGAMRSSEPYKEAMRRATTDPRVIAALDAPVEASFFSSGNIQVQNNEGTAKLDIPIHGPKASATLHVEATKMRGRWYYNQMIVTPKSGPEIDLMTSPEGSTSTAPPNG
ncbi:MAG TPA: cytochrome c oxidase assembly factor Coa1 family protein [Thermoanaerobaculia bacterium]|nr:cytochrome c oxidase assembly factor Coa1 family protein [Thermoanaerobaculia bacterium]